MSDDPRRQELGRFLRSRRERLTPQDAGLNHAGNSRRRTKGLRREEIAALAGISLPWYTSLEQGRDINVSDSVLDSLARVLQLNKDERKHLYFLAAPRRKSAKTSAETPTVPVSLQFMMDQLSHCPAYISDEKMNLVAWNALASAVFGPFERAEGKERNMLWRMFMLPSYRSMFISWDTLAGSLLGEFRAMYSRNISDQWYQSFIGELSASSPEFASLWESYEVVCTSQYPRVMKHPEAGLLNLSTWLFPVQESNGRYLTIFIPDQSDGSVERLATLAAGAT
ncbi:helix-turn-helix transcriptional regulator [Paenibacillus alkalitolerans]|uniref:helix-turn-helix transcriptional regulator n=1 Tax=Paenibacillus alkalitolerans TaxID=2799335 RepID=UPI0018F427DF|nr:helix-turn-helix transcriptional regulator [Paenibacillus alkalitolerans]